jgi:beta-galactosidase
MRNTILFNDNWTFIKEGRAEPVTLPHTWNAKDGTDGKNDYYRGTCEYRKTFARPETEGETWLEFRGAAMTAEVFLNGQMLARHEGGYSTFRVNLTEALRDENELRVTVDNGSNRRVYPQKADFTFYGGLYRDVYLITVPKEHFQLDYFGASGVKVTPVLSDDLSHAIVTVDTWHNADSVEITLNGETKTVKDTAVFEIENPRLWNGKKDPYLYTATAKLPGGDEVTVDFGIRKIAFDAERGFLLNNQVLRLCGAARHQDREGLGSALTKKEHEEDIALLLEMGANSVRLAHYQHDQYFYELCDRAGLIVWAEIPYITEHMAEGRENTVSQMTELVVQNYNHPSIVCWGLSNEITATTGVTEDLVENHQILNDLCHTLDATRPTTMAHVFMLSPDDPFVLLPDIRSYNLYYGWYVGDLEQNDQWFDDWHAKHPDDVMGLSEYGADANPRYQSAKPEKGDWTEGYQALYHEYMLKMWSERPYIWAIHCWNGFDFGADGRDEGGKPGQNQKGLVTFDRKIKKDAFYIYKAYLSDEPFVHITGRRYAERAEETTEIKVYSNQHSVTLFVDGNEIETKTGDKVFTFEVPLTGEHEIRAASGELSDAMTIRRVEKANADYVKPGTQVTNWFDREDEIVREGYFSIKDSMGTVKAHEEAKAVLDKLLAPLQAKIIEAYGDVAKNVQLPPEVQAMMDKMSVEASLKQMGKLVTPEFVHKLNNALNQVKK